MPGEGMGNKRKPKSIPILLRTLFVCAFLATAKVCPSQVRCAGAYHVSGTLVDGSGAPVKGGEVYFLPDTDASFDRFVEPYVTDATGRFTFDGTLRRDTARIWRLYTVLDTTEGEPLFRFVE